MEIIEVTNLDGTTTEHVIIDRGNEEFTSMPKSVYDETVLKQLDSNTWTEPTLTKF